MNYGVYLGIVACVMVLSGCAGDTGQELDYGVRKPLVVRNGIAIQGPPVSPLQLSAIAPAAGVVAPVKSTGFDGRLPSHCNLKDRFDRKELVAYQFADNKTRVGMKLSMDGFSWSDAGNFDLQEVKVNFRYRFQPIKKKRERCLYNSPWQGLVGSGYNELYLRDEQTVYEELDDELDRVEDRIQKLF